ncbi:MFS transporter [Pelagicoccus albus]|uniref:MFS transporter n=1 Tax=Pelagicoccus albus TaxID=415222 RepID=A0A7X1B8W5_9BACT|nr:MFS transporter [Pelagicoccus albus]MBC2607509.1 MFS transporter [Pelagicoccus albus]
MTTTRENANQRLAWREKISYGFGDLASVMFWQTFMAYLLFFYTDVFGISAGLAGTMFLLSRLLDGVNDPAMGMIADRTQTRWGKFRPYILWFSIPFAVLGVLTFTTPDFSYTGKAIWAFITFNLLMILYTVINIPYTSMLGVLTSNPNERTSLAQVKFLFAFIAGAAVSATLLPMTKALGGDNAAKGWQLSFVVYGILFVVFFLITFLGTKERVKPIADEKNKIGDDLKALFSNRPWIILLLATLTLILFIATRITVMAHYFKYFVGPQTVSLPDWLGGTREMSFEVLVSAFNTTGQISSIVGVLLVGVFSRMCGSRKQAFSILLGISIISTAVYQFLGPDQIGAIFFFQILLCVTSGPLSPLLWSMYADTADYGEWKSGHRSTGLVFSASTMGQKVGWAIGSAVAGWLLSAVGFQSNVEQTPEALGGLVLLVGLIPAGFGVLSLVVLAFYPLNEAKVKQIGAELDERRDGIA